MFERTEISKIMTDLAGLLILREIRRMEARPALWLVSSAISLSICIAIAIAGAGAGAIDVITYIVFGAIILMASFKLISRVVILTVTYIRLRRSQSVAAVAEAIQESKPPTMAQYLLELLASPDWSEAASGDFFEKYDLKFRRVRTKHGVLAAKLDYWWQVVRSAPGLLRIRLRDLAALAGLAKVFDVLHKYWTVK